jgi:hypothetical protein
MRILDAWQPAAGVDWSVQLGAEPMTQNGGVRRMSQEARWSSLRECRCARAADRPQVIERVLAAARRWDYVGQYGVSRLHREAAARAEPTYPQRDESVGHQFVVGACAALVLVDGHIGAIRVRVIDESHQVTTSQAFPRHRGTRLDTGTRVDQF